MYRCFAFLSFSSISFKEIERNKIESVTPCGSIFCLKIPFFPSHIYLIFTKLFMIFRWFWWSENRTNSHTTLLQMCVCGVYRLIIKIIILIVIIIISVCFSNACATLLHVFKKHRLFVNFFIWIFVFCWW